MRFELPWPPSVNHYWRFGNHHVHIADRGRRYRSDVSLIVGRNNKPVVGRVAMTIDAHPPDRRIRDLDNCLKALLDSVCEALAFDDSQIDKIMITRREVVPGGKVLVEIGEM